MSPVHSHTFLFKTSSYRDLERREIGAQRPLLRGPTRQPSGGILHNPLSCTFASVVCAPFLVPGLHQRRLHDIGLGIALSGALFAL